MSITANATNFLEFGVADGTPGWYAANTTDISGGSHALSYILKVKDPAGNAGYIPILAAVPS